MEKFTVAVCRVAYSIKEIEVEAETQEEADAKALEQAPNEIFDSEHASEYELESTLLNESVKERNQEHGYDEHNINRILIHLSGGVIQDIFADYPEEICPIVRDFDIKGSENEIAENGDLFSDGNDYYQEKYSGVSPMSNLNTLPFSSNVSPEDLK